MRMSLPSAARRLHGVEGEARGIGAGRPRDDRGADALAPDRQLLDGRGAERVAGREHDRVALARGDGAELADGRGLARAVDADDEDDEGLLGAEGERHLDGLQDLGDLARRECAGTSSGSISLS